MKTKVILSTIFLCVASNAIAEQRESAVIQVTADSKWETELSRLEGEGVTSFDELIVEGSTDGDLSLTLLNDAITKFSVKTVDMTNLEVKGGAINAPVFSPLIGFMDALMMRESQPEDATDPFDEAIANFPLRKVILPKDLSVLGYHVFYRSTVEEVVLPESLTEVYGSCFYGCKKLSQLNLPNSLRSVANGTFARSGLTSLTLPEGCEIDCSSTTTGLVEKCDMLEHLELPSNITAPTPRMALGCTALKSVVCHAPVPTGDASTPAAFGDGTPMDAILWVPKGSLSLYAAQPENGWGYFTNIEEMESSLSENIAEEDEEMVFTLSGIRVPCAAGDLPDGLYIVRKKNGSQKCIKVNR